METLPAEILAQVVLSLTVRDLLNLRLVSKHLALEIYPYSMSHISLLNTYECFNSFREFAASPHFSPSPIRSLTVYHGKWPLKEEWQSHPSFLFEGWPRPNQTLQRSEAYAR